MPRKFSVQDSEAPLLGLVVSDSLGCFNSVESVGCGHEAFITTGDIAAENRRHLPRYLAEFCYRLNRRFRLEEMIEQLSGAAVHTKPIPQHTLKLAEDWWSSEKNRSILICQNPLSRNVFSLLSPSLPAIRHEFFLAVNVTSDIFAQTSL